MLDGLEGAFVMQELRVLTPCFHYADYLRCVVENKKHFDQWLIITCSEDLETQELCAEHGMDCHVTKLTEKRSFHSSFYKAEIINEGLDRLEYDG